tara:strand:+ start:3066 stop:4067 length:1002 start_codon:yes stop_codon:yes gene_type:complete
MITETKQITMKKIMLIASAMLVSLTGALNAQTSPYNILTFIENAQAKAKTPEAKIAADNWTPRLGEGWKDTWRNSKLVNPNDHLVDIYIEKGDFPIAVAEIPYVRNVSASKKQEWLNHIGGKPTLTANDFSVVKALSQYNATVAAREAELAKFLTCGPGVKGEEYFQFLITTLEVRGLRGSTWQSGLRSDEWVVLASANAHFSPVTFASGRDLLAMKAARLFVEKRKASNLSVEGSEFDAAFAPILAALKTPKFGEFNAACEAVGIDMKLPAKIDWTAQQAVAQNVIAAAERNGKFVAPNGKEFAYELGLGSVMFIKGESAYNTWRAETIAKD